VRYQDREALVTVKGRGAAGAEGERHRSEWERPWSRGLAAELAEALRRSGAPAAASETAGRVAGDDPALALAEAGFAVIQDRFTLRRRRTVLKPDAPERGLGELALDEVRYELAVGAVRHLEVEIEVADGVEPAELRALVTLLDGRWPGTIRRWEHGKLATGLALERLLADTAPGARRRLLTAGGALAKAAYARLEKIL
jgi:hypothetical protein